MHHRLAIVEMKTLQGRRARFLPPIGHDLLTALQHQELPPGWRLWIEADPELSRVAQLPVVFDRLGPVDVEPVITAWLRSGRLVWDQHLEVEHALIVVNGVLAEVMKRRFDLVPTVPVPAASSPVGEEVLPAFAHMWEDYEVACAELMLATENQLAQDGPCSRPTEWEDAWQAYLKEVGHLKARCRRILERSRASDPSASYQFFGTPTSLVD